MVKVILFDFWGTLVENGVWSPIKQVKNILRINLPFPEYVVRMEKAMMTSKFNNLKEALESVCQEFKVQCNEETMDLLIGMWNKSWMLAHPYEEVEETLLALRGKYKIVLVSNTDCFSINNVLEKFNLQGLFDQLYFSYELGMIKTDQNFFKHVVTDMEVSVEDCVMIGDSIQSDIISAKRLGMKAILIDRKNAREFHPKIKNLKELENSLNL